MQKFHFALILTLSALMLNLWHIPSVQACSGLITFQTTIEGASAIVKAQFIALDDTGGNGVIRVETYYKGTGPEYAFLLENTIGEINGGFTSCGDVVQTIPTSIPPGEMFYMILYETGLSSLYNYGAIYYFPNAESSVYETIANDGAYESESRWINEAEFLELLADYTDNQQIAPDASLIPLPSVLRITTESGTEYFLPPDGSQPVQLSVNQYIDLLHEGYVHLGVGESYLRDLIGPDRDSDPCGNDFNCYLFSPNYAHIKRQRDENGNALRLLFSPTSEALAVWQDNILEIWGEYEMLNQVTLQPALVSQPQYAAWSHDGQFLAYSDQAGLWLWDIDREPRLLLPTENEQIPAPRHFSPLDTYLSVQSANDAEYVNLVSGERLPDGLLSPDEASLLAYDTLMAERSPFALCSVAAMDCREFAEILMIGDPIWLDEQRFLVNACEPPFELRACSVRMNNDIYGMDDDPLRSHQQFVYQSGSDLIAIVDEDNVLHIRKREFNYMRHLLSIDLSDTLDSPLASMEWLPSFMYYFEN